MEMPKKDTRGLLMANGPRDAGEADINGKHIIWKAGYYIKIIHLFDSKGQVHKYEVDPSKAAAVDEKLAHVNWGSVVEVIMNGSTAVDVDILSDYLDEALDS